MDKCTKKPYLPRRAGTWPFKLCQLRKMVLGLLFILPVTLYAQVSEPLLDIQMERATLKEVFDHIQKNSDALINYSPDEINDQRKVTVKLKQVTVPQLLKHILQNTGYEFVQQGNVFVIKRSPATKAQGFATGSVKGKILKAMDREEISGASVKVDGADRGVVTDSKGSFNIDGLRPGVYTLIFSNIGFKPDTLSGVEVMPGAATQVEVGLVPEASHMAEVVVRTRIGMNATSERGIIKEIQEAKGVVSAISNEQITKSLDRDASDVIRRVSSATVINDRFILLRGLDPRFTLTMLNGLIAPSSETDSRDFSFDMLQSNVIDRITIYKSPVPELPADYVGGVVKVFTKNTANTRQMQLQLSTQFRSGSSFRDFYTYRGSKTDWLGFDNTNRTLPKDLPSFFELPAQVDQAPYYGSRGLYEKVSRTSWNLKKEKAGLDKRIAFNYYDSWKWGKGTFNNLTSISYTYTRQTIGLNGAYIPGAYVESYRIDTTSTEGVRVGLMQNLRYVINGKHAITFNNFFNQLSDDNTLVRLTGGGGEFMNAEFAKVVQYRYRSRSLYAGQLAGDHTFGKSHLQWQLGYTFTGEQLPNYHGLGLARVHKTDSLQFFGFNGFGWTAGAFNYWQDLKENAKTATLDYEVPIWKSVVFRSGVFGEFKERSFVPRYFSNTAGGVNQNLPGDVFYRLDDYFKPENYASKEPGTPAGPYNFSFNDGTLREVHTAGYDASNHLGAWYAALSVPLFREKLTVYGGVRLEYNRRRLEAKQGYLDADNKPVYTNLVRDTTDINWLPSVNLTYKLNPSMQLRGGYGLTVNRPVFREVAPFFLYDILNNTYYKGNPGLYQATAANADLRWEWYLSDRDLISTGVFYKYIVDPIERYTVYDNIQPVNSIDARVLGTELEIRKRLDFIAPRALRHFSLIANFSWLYTKTRMAENIISDPSVFRGYVPRANRPMTGASPYVINAGLYYDNMPKGAQVSVLYNTAGNRLVFGGSANSIGEIYEMPRQVLDIVYIQRLRKNLSMKLGVQDLLNQSFRFFRDVDRNRKYNPTEYDKLNLAIRRGEALGPHDGLDLYLIPDVEGMDYMEYKYRPGSYFSFGLNFSF